MKILFNNSPWTVHTTVMSGCWKDSKMPGRGGKREITRIPDYLIIISVSTVKGYLQIRKESSQVSGWLSINAADDKSLKMNAQL